MQVTTNGSQMTTDETEKPDLLNMESYSLDNQDYNEYLVQTKLEPKLFEELVILFDEVVEFVLRKKCLICALIHLIYLIRSVVDIYSIF